MLKILTIAMTLSGITATLPSPVVAQTAEVDDKNLPLQCMVGSAPNPSGEAGQASVRVPQSKVANFLALGFQIVACPSSEGAAPPAGMTVCDMAERNDIAASTSNPVPANKIAEACVEARRHD
ncbi:MAG: hypothetical protein CL804_09655 [Citromicrobium sp.]|nr:hypothetical protein [Citromicrobium sp.]|tara:strand:- start:5158 stop:5526 length:369 start_codon:yes stop_codon:yes gene_type:complete